jgi:hypothetical protein
MFFFKQHDEYILTECKGVTVELRKLHSPRLCNFGFILRQILVTSPS